jgi:gamma-D-glutamyl-L-lysine dipeptidyl-peptidase
MQRVICLLPIIPIRKEPNHRSEQTSQLIFGEQADVLVQKDNWIEIKTLFDNYCGWIDINSVELKSNNHTVQNPVITTETITICEIEGHTFYLTAGSEISIPDSSLTFLSADKCFKLISPVPIIKEPSQSAILETALKFLDSPYLWGGRSVFGIDCSGFVQIVYKIHGMVLPRDASDQANAGTPVESMNEIVPGDLVFFDNKEGKITHVGIALNKKQIIHASVSVRIDNLDQKGIFNMKRNEYTHSLRLIRRIL